MPDSLSLVCNDLQCIVSGRFLQSLSIYRTTGPAHPFRSSPFHAVPRFLEVVWGFRIREIGL